VQRAVEAGLLVRRRSPIDARVVHVSLKLREVLTELEPPAAVEASTARPPTCWESIVTPGRW
jgi:hypothetical protein